MDSLPRVGSAAATVDQLELHVRTLEAELRDAEARYAELQLRTETAIERLKRENAALADQLKARDRARSGSWEAALRERLDEAKLENAALRHRIKDLRAVRDEVLAGLIASRNERR